MQISLDYILNYTQRFFLKQNSIWERENAGKVIIEIEPSALISQNNFVDKNCNDGNCLRRAYEVL